MSYIYWNSQAAEETAINIQETINPFWLAIYVTQKGTWQVFFFKVGLSEKLGIALKTDKEWNYWDFSWNKANVPHIKATKPWLESFSVSRQWLGFKQQQNETFLPEAFKFEKMCK